MAADVQARVVKERDVLKKCESLADFLGDYREPCFVEIAGGPGVPEGELVKRMQGRSGGDFVPRWALGYGGRPRHPIWLSRVRDVHYMPKLGGIIDGEGRLFRSSIGEALFLTPKLGQLPGVRLEDERPLFRAPDDAPHLARASVFLPWGALKNYGHFLLDGLTSLLALQDVAADFPLHRPAVTPWQDDLIARIGGGLAPTAVEGDLVRIDDAIFPSTMDHFLQYPSAIVRLLRDKPAAGAPPAGEGDRIYLSRRGMQKRVLHNEAALEEALERRGYRILRPETLSTADQIAAFRQARVVVGATGAAFANCVFAREGCQVIEIQPETFQGVWVRNLCEELDLVWRGFFRHTQAPAGNMTTEGVKRPVFVDFDVPLDRFLAFLDAHGA